MNCTGKRCIMQFDKVDPATCKCVSYCPQATPPKTNADRIRAMTDEELACFSDDIGNGCDNCPKRRYCLYEAEENCRDILLKWLKEEVDE